MTEMRPEDQAQTDNTPAQNETAGSAPQQADSRPEGEAAGPQTPPARRPAAPVEIPRADDDSLDAEIEAALGDMSLMDAYGDGQAEAAEATEQTGTPDELKAAGIRRGRVVSVTRDGLLIDVGEKAEGFLPREELNEGEQLNAGDTINVAVVGYDKRDGLPLLSRRTAETQLVASNLRPGSRVEARVTGVNKGGLELEIKGLKAFMPVSQVEIGRVENLEPYVGQKMECEVVQVERGDKNIVLSRRNLLEKERAEQGEKTMTELEEGQLRHGIVRNIMDYGAFVDLGGVDGLLHVREMSWAHVKHPKDILEVGQGVDVIVLEIDREKDRISLSLKQAGGDPWTAAEPKYPAGSRHQAQITNLADFGAFAQLEPGIEGLIPISQMSWAGRIRHPSDVVQPGGMVEVEVMEIDVNRRRMSLSMKRVQENPWTDITAKYRPDETYTGTVARTTDFGAFVTLEPGIDGLVHISELAERRVNRVQDVVREGDQVQVKVLSVDSDSQRIALTMRTSPAEGDVAATGPYSTESAGETEDKKNNKDRPRRGGLTWNF